MISPYRSSSILFSLLTSTYIYFTLFLVIGRPYLYTRKSTKFRIFFAISDDFFTSSITWPSHRIRRPLADDIGRALAEAPRRFTETFRAYPRLSLSFLYPPKPLSLSFSPRSRRHHQSHDNHLSHMPSTYQTPNYQNSSEIIAKPRKASETFGSSIYFIG